MPAAGPASPQHQPTFCRPGNCCIAWWQENQWIIIGLLSVLALGLGTMGFCKLNAPCSWADAFYLALQLFTLESGSAAGAKDWELQVARFLAPGLTAYAAIKAVLALFREEFQRFRLRFWKNHTVICGFGEKGQRLAADCLARGDRVVIIEAAENQEALESFREQGAIVLQGNAASPFLLAKAQVPSAKHVCAVTGDDGVNVEIAVQAQKMICAPGSPAEPLPGQAPAAPGKCYVHLQDTKLREVLGRNELLTGYRGTCQARFFDIYETAARLVFREYPPDHYAWLQGTHQVHLLIVGFGAMGESLALHAARLGHYDFGTRVRLTVVDAEAETKGKIFLQRYPMFLEICDLDFHTMRLEDPEFFELNFLAGAPPTMAFICLENEKLGFLGALHLFQSWQAPPCPILVRVKDEAGLASLFPASTGNNSQGGGIYPFGSISRTCNLDMILNETIDTIAREFHAGYVRLEKKRGKTPVDNPAMVPWDELPADLKNSNWQAAEHIEVKLRALGYRTRPKKPGETLTFAFTPKEVEFLAEMEHNRWNAERWLAGWQHCGPGIDKATRVAKKLSPYLVPYDKLSEEVKDYDRHAVRDIPMILDQMGLAIER